MPFCVTINTCSPGSAAAGTVICTLKLPPERDADGDAVPMTGPVMLSIRISAGAVRASEGSCAANPLPSTVTVEPATPEDELVLIVANPVHA